MGNFYARCEYIRIGSSITTVIYIYINKEAHSSFLGLIRRLASERVYVVRSRYSYTFLAELTDDDINFCVFFLSFGSQKAQH